MYEGIDGSSGYGASQGGYGGLGIGNPGSYGGSNSLDTSSTSTSVHDGSGHSDSSSHSSSNAGSVGSEQSRSEGGFEGLGIGNPGSYCSVSDLCSSTQQTKNSEEENADKQDNQESDSAGGRIITQGLVGAGRGAITGALAGTPALGIGAAPSALAGGIIGFSVGLLQGAVCEAFGCQEKLENIQQKYDDFHERFENLEEPVGINSSP